MPEIIADLHIHTKTSSDFITNAHYGMEEALTTAIEKGISVVAITEHGILHDYNKSQQLAEKTGVILIPAVELKGIITEGLRAKVVGPFAKLLGEAGPIADILAYGVTEPIPENRPIELVTKDIHRQDGLAVLAHPSVASGINWYGPVGRKLIKELGIDGIEVLNASIPQFMNRAAARLAKEFKLPITGGSDARWLRFIGKGLTVFSPDLKIQNWRDCIQAIKDSKTSVGGVGIRLGPFFS